MNNNLPVEATKDNVFKRFFKFLKSLVRKEKDINIEISKKEPTIKKANKMAELYKVENLDEINASIINENNQKRKLAELIQIIEKDPTTLEKLDISKLEIIDQYYKNKISECKNKLKDVSNQK